MKYLFASYLFITPTIFGQVFDGMTLFSPAGGGGGGGNFSSFLIDNDLNAINTWDHPRGAASMPYFLPDSTLIYPYRVTKSHHELRWSWWWNIKIFMGW